MKKLWRTLSVLVGLIACCGPALAAPSADERSLAELRNTVLNLLQGLVQRGILTREQAEEMVKNAQDKAAAEAAAGEQARQAQEKADENAVRVPYVPQIVKDEISKQVAEQVTPEVTRQVVSQAKTEGWGIPAALPDWIERIKWSGDLRVRSEGDVFAKDNVVDTYPYLNWMAINNAGGFSKAGLSAFLNTSIDRYYLLARLRLNMDAALPAGWHVGARLSTGTLYNPDSLNQVLGQYGSRYQTNVDLAYISWTGGTKSGRQGLSLWGGKFANPFVSSELIWDTDVTFEGVAAAYRLGIAPNPAKPLYWFMTLGAFPVQEIPLSSNDKWLYAGQTGVDLKFSEAGRVRLGVAYYDFNHMAGQLNSLNSNLLDFTAAPYTQKGNSMFDIRNSTDPTQNLFALASEFRELDYLLTADWMLSSRYGLSFYADYVKNLAYDEAAVSARLGFTQPPRIHGYQSELALGTPKLDRLGDFRVFAGYRYLQRDAVLDAFTDQDYHLGGTDAKGYYVGFDVNLSDWVWARARYMPFNAIDGPPLAISVWQAELNARF